MGHIYRDFSGDYKEKLRNIIKQLQEDAPNTSESYRITYIFDLINDYILQTGERPDGDALYRLSNVILYDHLEGDTRPNKVQADEYPILTDIQLRFRRSGATRERNAQGVIYKEVPLNYAGTIATNGINYALPIRKMAQYRN